MINYNCPIQGYDMQIGAMIPEGTIVNKGDTICYLTCIDLATRYDDAVKNYDLAKSELEKTKAQQFMESKILESQVRSLEASASISMLDSSQLEFYTPIKRKLSELNLEKAKIQIGKYRRKIDYMKRINDAVLNKLQLRIQQQDNRAKRFLDQLNKLKMVADTTGILQYANVWSTGRKAKIGDVVWGRSPIMNIIDVSSLQVKLETNETNFKQIQKDNILSIRIDAGDTTVYKGKITMKFPEGKTVDRESTVKYFELLSSIEPKPRNIQPGVSVTCTVFLNDVKDTIVIPLISVFEYDSTKVVYLLKKNKFKRQEVKTGPSSEKEILISSGLKPNDKISISEPPESLLQ
jgi:hypothetical protein